MVRAEALPTTRSCLFCFRGKEAETPSPSRQKSRRGHAAHQRYINRPLGMDESEEPETAPIDWLAPAYWESDAPRRPQKGTWLFAHSFKFPYSLLRLLRVAEDEALRAPCLKRGASLYVPFA